MERGSREAELESASQIEPADRIRRIGEARRYPLRSAVVRRRTGPGSARDEGHRHDTLDTPLLAVVRQWPVLLAARVHLMWLPAGRLIRAVLLVVSLLSGDDGACGAAVLPPHASALKFKPCEKDSAAQRFKIPAAGETGLVVDSDTGRCLAVLDCLLPNKQPQLQAAGMGVVVLDECGAGSCDGANQQWTHVTSTAGHFELVSTLNPTFAMGEGRQLAGVLVESWKLMGTFNPENVDNENVVVQKINPVANTAFSQTNPAETWTGLEIGSALAGGAGGYGPTCPAGDHCVRRPSAPLSCPVVRWLLRALPRPAVASAVSRSAAVCSSVLTANQLRLEFHNRVHSLQHGLRRWWHRLQPQGKGRKTRGRKLAAAIATRGALAGSGRVGERRHELLKDELGCVRFLTLVHLPARPACQSLAVLFCQCVSRLLHCARNRYRKASGAIAQVAGSAGGYESLADLDEMPDDAKVAPTPPVVAAAVASESSPFDTARSGSESEEGEEGGADNAETADPPGPSA